MQTPRIWSVAGLTGLALTLVLTSAVASEQSLKASMAEQGASDDSSIKSQKRIAQMADQTTELVGEYRLALQKLDRVKIYNNHLQKLVNDQEAEKSDIDRQLNDFQTVQTEIVPLMFDMIENLAAFISLDMPFNLEERGDRVDRLRSLMDDSNITISEKYRKIMEAYEIETSFGRDMEAREGTLDIGGEAREVDFLRIGRIVLAYQTRDKDETGFWNKTSGQWESLPAEYRESVTAGLRVARKQSAPNLLKMPVPGPQETGQ
jgi:hypothetical protein